MREHAADRRGCGSRGVECGPGVGPASQDDEPTSGQRGIDSSATARSDELLPPRDPTEPGESLFDGRLVHPHTMHRSSLGHGCLSTGT
jgi:hypothetical protein